VSPPAHTQVTRKGVIKAAKTPNSDEIVDIVRDLLARIQKCICAAGEQPCATKPFPAGFKPRISLDNAACHTRAKAVLREDPAFCAAAELVDLPPWSPDLHKVIEHTHANLQRVFLDHLGDSPSYEDVPAMFAKLQQLFQKHITAESVQKDVLSLQHTAEAIIKCDGYYPDKALR